MDPSHNSGNHTSLTVLTNLAVSLENRKKDGNALFYWDARHGTHLDAANTVA